MAQARTRKEKTAPLSEAQIQNELASFFESNPRTTLGLSPLRSEISILKPWDDESVALTVPKSAPRKFFDALNQVVLPARYSGIWHKDTRDFEILWTAFEPSVDGVSGRSFNFNWRQKIYECEFAPSSDRTLVIAKNFEAIGPSSTDYRNLTSFGMYAEYEDLRDLGAVPLSFWIRNIDWDEDLILDLALHLNFYLKYFDDRSPVIIIHPPAQGSTWSPRNRYIDEIFPKTIRSQAIDTTALFLWDAARTGDNARHFIYYYRIIEYSAVSYLDHTARTALRIALAAPNALDDIISTTDQVVGAVQRMKLEEYERYTTMLGEVLKPKLLWKEIQPNLQAFTTETHFDGGFALKPMFTGNRDEADFTDRDVQQFAVSLRTIRNHLSHGRDPRTSTMIAPTSENFIRLQPWVGVAALAASQVLIYKDVF